MFCFTEIKACKGLSHLTHVSLLATLQAGKISERTGHDSIYGNHHPGAWAGPVGRPHVTGTRSIGTGSIKRHHRLLSHIHSPYSRNAQAGNTRLAHRVLRLFLRRVNQLGYTLLTYCRAALLARRTATTGTLRSAGPSAYRRSLRTALTAPGKTTW